MCCANCCACSPTNATSIWATARIPYDSKSSETVQLFARQCARFLADQWVKLIVVASSWRDVRFCLTDIPPTFVPIAERFLGFPVNRVERVEIDHLGA